MNSLADSSVSDIREIVEEHTSFPANVDKVLESDIKDLMDIDLSETTKKLEKRVQSLRNLTQRIVEKRRSVVSKLRDEKKKRDELNQKVQKAAKNVRELIEEREEVNELIDEKHERLDEIRAQMKQKRKTMEELKETLQNFSMERKRKIENKLERVNWNLQTRSLPENIEERLVKLTLSLERKLKKYREKEENLQKVRKLDREIKDLEQERRAIKSSLAAYYQEGDKLTEQIHKYAKKRNKNKDLADDHHQKFIKYAKETDKLNDLLSKIKQTKIQLIQTLRKIRALKSERRDIKQKERLEQVMKDRIQSIRERLTERGSIDFEDLTFLLEHGFLSREIIGEFPNMRETEKREKILSQIEEQIS